MAYYDVSLMQGYRFLRDYTWSQSAILLNEVVHELHLILLLGDPAVAKVCDVVRYANTSQYSDPELRNKTHVPSD